MARVTVEDCVQIVPNRFELVVLAAQRSREISAGAPLTVERDNDKNPVIALREIAEKSVSKDELDDSLAQCDPRLRVSTEIEQLIRAIDKEFSQMGNYAKGHGAKQFGPWLKRTYPSDFVLTEERAQGSRQVSPRPPHALRALPALQIVPSAPLHRR